MGNSAGIWSILENPLVYRLSQALLAPGAEEAVMAEVRDFCHPALNSRLNLDVGSGPRSLLRHLPLQPVGLDPIHAYNLCFQERGKPAVTATATALPFLDDSFDNVWNFGLLHHLSDEEARRAVKEMVRVVRPGGRVVVFDGVMPPSAFRRPPLWLLRKLDRGRHMRRQEALECLLAERERWRVRRFQYCVWGHEGILCVYQKHKNGN